MTSTGVTMTPLVLGETNAVFVLCFKTVFWARRCSIKQRAELTEGLQKMMPLHVMQGDKCDFEVFFNIAVEKCGVIGQSRAATHRRSQSFRLWRLLLTNWIKLTTRENRSVFCFLSADASMSDYFPHSMSSG